MDREVIWIPGETRNAALKRKPVAVWTILGTEPPTDLEAFIPVHNRNAFVEDYVHDWNWRKGVLRYYSRIAVGDVWILVDYGKACPGKGCTRRILSTEDSCSRHRAA